MAKDGVNEYLWKMLEIYLTSWSGHQRESEQMQKTRDRATIRRRSVG